MTWVDFSNTSILGEIGRGWRGVLGVKKGVVSVRIWRCARLIWVALPLKGQQKHEELGFHLDFLVMFFFGADIMKRLNVGL